MLLEARFVQDYTGKLQFSPAQSIRVGPTLQPDEEQAEDSLQPYLMVAIWVWNNFPGC